MCTHAAPSWTGLLLLAGLLPHPTVAQAPTSIAVRPAHHYVGFGIGAADVHVRDEWLSPLAYRGRSFAPTLFYRRAGPRSQQGVQALLSSGPSRSDTRVMDGNYMTVLLSVEYARTARRTAMAGRPLAIQLGGELSTFAWKVDIEGDYANAPSSWYWSTGARLVAGASYEVSAVHRLSARFTTPVVHWVVRPDYSLSERNDAAGSDLAVFRNGRARYFWDDLAVSAALVYAVQIADPIGLALSYRLDVSTDDSPHPVTLYVSAPSVALFWHFGPGPARRHL